MKPFDHTLLLGVSALSLSCALAVPAMARATDAPGANAVNPVAGAAVTGSDTASPDDEVVVTGVRASLRDSLAVKRSSDLISDVISTKDIGQLPDVTIAEELNRLPGVNTTRDRGNASQASVRGLGPRFVFGLVNGREVASSEPSQDVRWEVYPSEVLSGAQVYKTQDASLVPGGIAATIDIRTLTPLDYKGPAFNIRGGPTYNEAGKSLPHYSPWGYRASAGYISHLTDTLAVAFGASFQKEKNGFPDFRTFGWNTLDNAGVGNTGDLNGDKLPDNTTWGLVTEVKEVTQNRQAYVANIGWEPTDTITVNLDSLYSKYTINENQFQSWYGNNITGNYAGSNASIYNAPGNSYQIVDGSVVAASLKNNAFPNYQSEISRYKERHELMVFGLNTKWKSDNWEAVVDLSHSEAQRHNRWESIWLETKYATGLVFDVRDGQKPFGQLLGPDVANPAIQAATPSNDPSFNGRDGQSAGPEYTKDRISAATVSLKRNFDGGFFKSFEIGGRLSDRVKNHTNYQYNLCAGSTSSGFCDASAHRISLANAGLEEFTVKGFTAPPVVWGDFDKLFPLVYPKSDVPSFAEQLLQRTRVGEKTAEAYAKLSFSGDGSIPVNGSFGIRVEHVKTASSGFQQIGGAAPSPIAVSNRYTEYLPSLNLTAHLTQDQQLRFGASIGISRPPLEALVTGFVLNPIVQGSPPTGGGGNPFLKPYRAKQLDLSYENYFHEESLFALALYYKHLDSFIGASSATQTINGVQYIISGVNNGKGGDIGGAEATFQTRFYFLPGLLQDFGVYANYARVASNIKEFAPNSDPYPMVGVAKNTAEFDTFYSKSGFEARLAVKYHSRFTVAPTWVGTTLKSLSPETSLDASLSYQLTKAIGLRFQARNLTNERARFTSDNNRQNLSNDGGYQLYGRSYLADISFRF